MNEAIKKGECSLLDVREQVDFEAEHIPLAILTPHAELNERASGLKKDKKVIVYCRTEGYSKRIAETLTDKGFREVYVLEGGFLGWKDFQKRSVR